MNLSDFVWGRRGGHGQGLAGNKTGGLNSASDSVGDLEALDGAGWRDSRELVGRQRGSRARVATEEWGGGRSETVAVENRCR